ncbi:hypothetical protein [Sphingobacterium spiritivorum]|uniref:hypothetical protein n=1 Tax=Sphingobacterium spiritivorum TaxID=258 RepID=UPI0019192C81|nr:hypothetical protein [Sphingobacterium spiritivorum]QQT26195.1 hypothetical protein I6J02_21260 [Sphingobacterium spiritivorum]
MIKRIFLFTLSAGFLAVSCQSNTNQDNSSKNAADTSENVLSEKIADIPFTEAEHYFVKNTYTNSKPEELKITSQEEFDRIFGMAAVMGEDGTPTSIDFAKVYVLAVIGTVTDTATTISASTLKQVGDHIVLDYTVKEAGKQSYTVHPVLMILVDKQYQGEVRFNKQS